MKTNVEVLSQACVRESAWMDHPQVVLSTDLCAEKGFSGQLTIGHSSVLPLVLATLTGSRGWVFFPSPLAPAATAGSGPRNGQSHTELVLFPVTTLMTQVVRSAPHKVTSVFCT